MIRDDWAHLYLDRCGVSPTDRHSAARACIAQMQSEGGNALYNPLNCVMVMPGSWSVPGNTAGVQNYVSLEQGLDATVRTITQHCCGFPLVLERMRDPSKSAFSICRAIRKSEWGTGTLIYAVLADIRLRGYYWEYAGKVVAGTG